MFVNTLIVLSAILFFFVALIVVCRTIHAILNFKFKKPSNTQDTIGALIIIVGLLFLFSLVYIFVGTPGYKHEPNITRTTYDKQGNLEIRYYDSMEKARQAEIAEKINNK